jgi:hypothetical protein
LAAAVALLVETAMAPLAAPDHTEAVMASTIPPVCWDRVYIGVELE